MPFFHRVHEQIAPKSEKQEEMQTVVKEVNQGSPPILTSISPTQDVKLEEKPSSELEDQCPAHLVRISKVAPSMNIPNVVHFKKGEIKIGRAEGLDMFLDSTLVPRMISRLRNHAKIVQTSELDENGMNKWKISDLNSVNGIFVNSVKVQEIFLKNDDIVVFGGGGMLPMNSVREDSSNSEFIYQFKLRKPSNKRKMEEEMQEMENKRQKILQETQKQQEILEELARKTKALEEQERKYKELEETLNKNEEKMRQLKEEQEKKEKEIVCQQMSNFHAQLARVQSDFDNERSKLIEEKKKLEEESAKQNAEIEAKQKILQQQLQEKEQKLTEMSTSVISRDDLQEEFTCTICQELILCAMTLECSHSFCSHCLDEWFTRKKQCPVCREPITKAPTRSRAVDNAVSKLAETLPRDEQAAWKARVAEQSKRTEEEQTFKRLQELISSARSKNMRFLSIKDTWSIPEKKVFVDGLKRYTGKARMLYCETTGLTRDFISSASVLHLRIAATNLELASSDTVSNTQELKRLLNAFLDGALK